MKIADARGRLLREERGFTLPEMMVTMVVMIVVLFALYNIFDMSIRIFSLGNDKVEATENARLGLEKMEREVRAAYPYDLTTSPALTHVFFSTTSPNAGTIPATAQITFGNELDAAGASKDKLLCTGAAGSTCEYITYKLTNISGGTCTAAPCTLRRVNTNNSSNIGDAVVEFVQPNGLTFTYFEADGTAPETEAEIVRVQVRLQVSVKGRTQNLRTDVDLRNRTSTG